MEWCDWEDWWEKEEKRKENWKYFLPFFSRIKLREFVSFSVFLPICGNFLKICLTTKLLTNLINIKIDLTIEKI
jgi:hypothetical protein